MLIMLPVFFSNSISLHNNANICGLELKVNYCTITNNTPHTKITLYKRRE